MHTMRDIFKRKKNQEIEDLEDRLRKSPGAWQFHLKMEKQREEIDAKNCKKTIGHVLCIILPYLFVFSLAYFEFLHHQLLASFVLGIVFAEAGMYFFEIKKKLRPVYYLTTIGFMWICLIAGEFWAEYGSNTWVDLISYVVVCGFFIMVFNLDSDLEKDDDH
jgi:hypothetical protein